MPPVAPIVTMQALRKKARQEPTGPAWGGFLVGLATAIIPVLCLTIAAWIRRRRTAAPLHRRRT